MHVPLHRTLPAIVLLAFFAAGAIDGLVRSATKAGPPIPWKDGFAEEERNVLVGVNGLLHRLMCRRLVSRSKNIDIVLLDNGQLALGSVARTNAERRKGIGDIKRRLSFVRDELAKSQIPLIFVLCPSKVPPGGVGLPPGLEDDDNLLGDLLVKTLRKVGIDCLDLRERIAAEKLDHASLFFRTDHHWTPSAGLWAANEVAAYLHDHYGMGFDPELTAPKRYRTYRMSDAVLGSYGRRVGPWYVGCDTFDALLPVFSTDFELDVPSIKYHIKGPFSRSLIRNLNKRYAFWNDDPYGRYLPGKSGFARLVNRKRGNGKTLCVIKDSFASVLLPHLAIQYGKLVMLDPRMDPNIPLFSIIKKENVDALVYILNPNSLIRRKNGFFGRQMLRH